METPQTMSSINFETQQGLNMPVDDFDLCPGIYSKQMGVFVRVCPCMQRSPNLEDKHFDSCSLQLYQS